MLVFAVMVAVTLVSLGTGDVKVVRKSVEMGRIAHVWFGRVSEVYRR
jgi:hypothetical protein